MKSESKLVNESRQNDSFTDNGAVTHSTSLSNLVDFFFIAWTLMQKSSEEYLPLWNRAFAEDKTLAMRLLFWMRDVRWWAWVRDAFITIYSNLSQEDKKHYSKYISEYWRWDDLIQLYKSDPESFKDIILAQFKSKDSDTFGLFCKWFPRKGFVFHSIRKELGLDAKEMRDLIVSNTKVVEQLMSAKKWSEIKYNTVPAKAFNIYKKSFEKNDESRFNDFIKKKPELIKSWTLYPYELYKSFQKWDRKDIIDQQWKNLPNYISGNKSFLPVVDVSGSMESCLWTIKPMDVSVSLWVYLSERNKSIFRDAFITFSEKPKMEYLQWTATQRFQQLYNAEWWYNTNLEAVFDLILDTAKRENLKQEDMPEYLIILSDMEFDRATLKYDEKWYLYNSVPNYKSIKQKYDVAWYSKPNIVFWNLNWRIGNVPVSFDEHATALISGFSPAIMKSILGTDILTPEWVMLFTLNSQRYSVIN